MKLDGILFDLDGTLWDSTEGVSVSFNRVLQRHPGIRGEITIADIAGVMGLQKIDVARKLFPAADDKTGLQLIAECFEEEQVYLQSAGSVLYPQVKETLEILSKKHTLAIVSNCSYGYLPCFFAAHPLAGYFADTECSGRTGLLKGENIKLVMERNNLKNIVYVGDTQTDADAAKLADVPFVFAAYGFGKVEKADYIIQSFEELLDIVK